MSTTAELLEQFKEAWFAIDKQCKGRINGTELALYMQKQDIDASVMQTWLILFDKEVKGYIEVDEFCDVLGLNLKEFMGEARTRTLGNKLPTGVEFISGDMEITWQIKIAQLCLEGLRSNAAFKDVPKWIKTQADRQYNRLWHVVMLNGQFWCHYGHEPGYSFVFRYGKHIFIIWKTPMV